MPSYVSYLGNGSVTDFAVPFPYLRTADVVARVNGSVTSFTWVNAALIRISPAPANGATVLVSRVTSYSTPRVDWQDNASFKAADLRTDTLQALYAVEEARDAIDLVTTSSGNVPAPGASNVGKNLQATGANTFGWSDVGQVPAPVAGDAGRLLRATGAGAYAWADFAPASKISVISGAYGSAGAALSTTPLTVLDLNLPADTAMVHVSGFVRADNQSATGTDLIGYMQVLNASNVVQATLTVHKSSGIFGSGRYMQGGLGGATTIAAGNSGWKLRFSLAISPSVASAFVYDLSASAMVVQR